MLLNGTDTLFRLGIGVSERVHCGSLASFSLYCLVPEPHLEVARYTTIAVLVLVMIGWRPRVTGILHFYVAYSFHSASILVDGGEQVSAVLTFLLIPVTLTDSRRFHWANIAVIPRPRLRHLINKSIAISALIAIRVQISVIYLNAATAKTNVPEWLDGTAMYYWLNNPYVGLPLSLQPAFEPLLTSILVAPLTWSVLVLELLLAGALFMPPAPRVTIVAAGILFHIAIVFLMGISSFAIAMIGALVLYLWPIHLDLPLAAIFRRSKANPRAHDEILAKVASHEYSSRIDK